MILFLKAAVNPALVENFRIAKRGLLVLGTYVLFALIFLALLALFVAHLSVVYGQRLFNFAIDCFLGVLE